MANRSFNRRQALEKEVKDLYAAVSIGASGAPTLTSRTGIASITRTSAGLYQLTLQDEYSSLKYFEAVLLDPDGEDINVQVKAEDVDGAKTIDFFTLTGASATDPSNGAKLLIKIEVKNTSVE